MAAGPRAAAVMHATAALRPMLLLLAVSALVGGLLATVQSEATGPYTAVDAGQSGSERPVLVLNGRGWGHGRGLGQYGAHGYAVNFGWTSAQILNHYYGGTSAGPAPSPGVVDPARVRVDLVSMRGRDTTVNLGDGTMRLMAGDGSTLRRVTGAVRLTVNGGSMEVATASGCAGPWTTQTTIDRSLVRIAPETAATGQSGLLEVCGPTYRTWYDGEIWATTVDGRQRTLNLVSVEQYLKGVVPNEMPASWDTAALESQAVAARSYALAGDPRLSGFADTCDTTTCQVYDGRFTTRGGALRTASHPRTDAAIAATSGLVRLTPGGAVARTEFSSSTGGHTAGGDFPAVPDLGDAVSINPNHRWQAAVDLHAVEASANLGPLVGVTVGQRNGFGDDGGRAGTVTYQFRDGTQTVGADAFRRQFGLKSNWFTIVSLTRGGFEVASIDPADVAVFVDRAFQRLQGRPPTTEEAAIWNERVPRQSRISLTNDLVHSEYFSGVLVDGLYGAALGRPADAAGRSYWVATMAEGLKYEQLGTLFYGSPEYVRRVGGDNRAFVLSLYINILGRPADAEGLGYWLGLLDTGAAGPAEVANAFYRSVESRRDRASDQFRRVMAAEPTPAQTEAGAARLLLVDDLDLAAELAASPQFTGES